MATLPGKYDFRFVRGTTWTEELRYRDAEGAAIPLTGIRVRLVVLDYGTGATLLNLASDAPGSGLTTVNATGTILWTLLPPALTGFNPANAPAKHYKYRLDFEDTNPGGSVFPHMAGSVVVEGT